ncbi:MAG: HD domain-containing protein [Candidatus Kaiserbacteria bacterium]|nr:HD domain-containing protein [Candidatus Kaiserbacteria bacterium]
MKKRDLEFLFEIGSLRNFERAWRQHAGLSVASTPEHTFRVAFLALLIAREEGLRGSDEKILKMALLHDVAETRTGDLGYVQRVYVKADDHKAASDMFADTSFGDLEKILQEYEARSSKEAKIVKDADNLEYDLEIRELEEQGHKLPKKLAGNRRLVRDKKFYTKTAKRLWDALKRADPDAWHLKANKWKKLPGAGR